MSDTFVIALTCLGSIVFFGFLTAFFIKNAKKKKWNKSESDLKPRKTDDDPWGGCYSDPR